MMSEDRGYSFHEVYQVSEEDQLTRFADRPVSSITQIAVGLLCAAYVAIWVLNFTDEHWLMRWGINWPAILSGHYETLWLHMFAHAGLFHLAMNVLALWDLGPQVMLRFGAFPRNLLAFAVFYVLSGFAGMAAFLILHPYGSVPMIGASGAICGLLGLFWRLSPDDDSILPPWSKRTWVLTKRFAFDHLHLIVLFTLPALLHGTGGGVAWEAHLGGLLFGLLIGPKFVRSNETDAIVGN
jgi:membrane associated rhomboid family serine protease